MSAQGDLFDGYRLVSRWTGDGPHSFRAGREYCDGLPRAAFFDGVGEVEMPVFLCDCGVHHPVDFDWSTSEFIPRVGCCG